VEWKTDQRLTPEVAFSHPFISKAVNELKCLRQTGTGSVAAERSEGLSSAPSAPEAGNSTEGKQIKGGESNGSGTSNNTTKQPFDKKQTSEEVP
jgi:hypothetical protein